MNEEPQTISLYSKAVIWLRSTIFLGGLVFFGLIIKSSIYGIPQCLQSVEIRDANQKVEELAHGLATAQDDLQDVKSIIAVKLARK